MLRTGSFLVLCLLLVLLPLRSVLAARHLGSEAAQATHAHHGGHQATHHVTPGESHDAEAKACKLCTPCCLAAAPPPTLMTNAESRVPAARAAAVPEQAWVSIVPPLPDPPPRA